MCGGPMPLADGLGALTVGSRSLPTGERHAASSSHRVDSRASGHRMNNYAAQWIPSGAVFGAVLLLLIVPEFAVIALLIVLLAAHVAFVALAAAALASPYLLTRALRRRPAQRNP